LVRDKKRAAAHRGGDFPYSGTGLKRGKKKGGMRICIRSDVWGNPYRGRKSGFGVRGEDAFGQDIAVGARSGRRRKGASWWQEGRVIGVAGEKLKKSWEGKIKARRDGGQGR